MSVSKTAAGRWRARISHGGHQVAMATFDKKRDADAWEAEQKRQLIAGTWTDPRSGQVKLAAVIADFNRAREGFISRHAWDTDEANLRNHLPVTLTRRPIGTIKSTQLEDLYAAMLRILARRTVQRVRDSFVALWRYAVDRGIVPTNVAEKSVVPRGTGAVDEVVRPFTKQELGKLIDAAAESHPGYARAVEFSALTGVRWGELAELRARDLSLGGRVPTMRVRRSRSDGYEVTATKSRRERQVPLGGRSLEIAASLLVGREGDDLLFTSVRGHQMLENSLKRSIRWSDVASGHRWHDLRHTAATMWIAAGIDVKTVSKWLGHSNSAITHRVYIGWLGQESDLAALEKLAATAPRPSAPAPVIDIVSRIA